MQQSFGYHPEACLLRAKFLCPCPIHAWFHVSILIFERNTRHMCTYVWDSVLCPLVVIAYTYLGRLSQNFLLIQNDRINRNWYIVTSFKKPYVMLTSSPLFGVFPWSSKTAISCAPVCIFLMSSWSVVAWPCGSLIILQCISKSPCWFDLIIINRNIFRKIHMIFTKPKVTG